MRENRGQKPDLKRWFLPFSICGYTDRIQRTEFDKISREKIQYNAIIIMGGDIMPKEQCLQKAMDYIENNLNSDISYYDIACEAGISVPHFYRLFKRLTGDTVGAYILRRRISMAANDLTDSDKSIVSIAFEYGFESHDVFTRANGNVTGVRKE